MKKFQRFLVYSTCIFSGNIASSLLVTNSESWKVSLPLAILFITAYMVSTLKR